MSCIICKKEFKTTGAMNNHKNSKPHKRKLKAYNKSFAKR